MVTSQSMISDAPSLEGRPTRLSQAWEEVGRNVVVGLSLGAACVILGAFIEKWIDHENVVTKLIEHLGMGFFVAAIAVFFYEWGAHLKDSLRLREDSMHLRSDSMQLRSDSMLLRDDSVKLSTELKEIRDAVATNALENVFLANLRGEGSDKMVHNLGVLVHHLKGLQEQGDWVKEGYIQFLGHSLENLTKNAERLCNLSTPQKQDHNEFHVIARSPATSTDDILAEQMRLLPHGSRYSVVSNIESWEGGQLSELGRASEMAVRKGVHIRRIFVLGGDGANRSTTPLEETRQVLLDHCNAAKSWTSGVGGKYEMRILDVDRLQSLRLVSKKVADAVEFVFDTHYGVFERDQELYCLRVEVSEKDLSDLRMTRMAPASATELQRFNTAWEKLLPDVPTSYTIQDALDRLVKRSSGGL